MKQVFEHGYVKLVESWGSDERIIEAARMSTNKGFQGWGSRCVQCGAEALDGKYPEGPCSGAVAGDSMHAMKPGDEKLLRYLWENKHATPFEMAGAVIEVQAPIFVFREWHRHRTQSYNELSARYVPMPDVNYVPSLERLMAHVAGGNKQAGTIPGAETLTEVAAASYQRELRHVYEVQQVLYDHALKIGVPKEVARVHLPVGRYSRMRASANLRNWLGFLTLRMDEKAQWEIRQYAQSVHEVLSELFPRTLGLFDEGRPG